MPRSGIKKNKTTSVAVQEGCRSVPRGVPFPLFTCAISSFFAPKPHGNACYAGYGGPREQCRSVPRGGIKKKGSVEDRESVVALCHGVALKKKKRERERERGRERERERDRSRTERAVSFCATGWR